MKIKINRTKGDCWCLKCKQPFNGWVFTEIYGKHTGELSQRECFCSDCVNQLISEHMQFVNLDFETTVYTAKQVNINHKMHKVVLAGEIDCIELYNYCDLYNVVDKLELPYFGYACMEYRYGDFSPQKLKDFFTYYIIDNNGKRYKRNLNEIYKSKDDCLNYINEKNGYISSSDITDFDRYVIKEKKEICHKVKTFLNSDEAIQSNINGIEIKLENGYVNASWLFKERREGDIKYE